MHVMLRLMKEGGASAGISEDVAFRWPLLPLLKIPHMTSVHFRGIFRIHSMMLRVTDLKAHVHPGQMVEKGTVVVERFSTA